MPILIFYDSFCCMLATKSIKIANICSAPGCKSNLSPENRISVFRMPHQSKKLRHSWL